MKIALVHDMAEALVGDIAPHQNISKQDKQKMELEAMEKIRDTVGGTIGILYTLHRPILPGQEIFSLWNEYEEQSTPEATIVKQFDKFEMILQALEYEKGLHCCSSLHYSTRTQPARLLQQHKWCIQASTTCILGRRTVQTAAS